MEANAQFVSPNFEINKLDFAGVYQTAIVSTNLSGKKPHIRHQNVKSFGKYLLNSNEVGSLKKLAETKKMTQQEDINSRISFIFGAGAAGMLSTIYEEPVVDKVSGNVKINEGSNLKTSISLGIVYTPQLWTIDNKKDIAKGISYALFISPTTIGTLGNNLIKTNIDAGFGIGYRTVGGFSVFAVVDFFSLRQPRDYFVNEFKSNDKVYTVNGEIQSSLDISDNAIFYDKLVTSIGFKFCYTFDIVNAFKKQSSN